MTDLAHIWGGDLAMSAVNDLATVDGLEKGRQRILRRLMTGPGEYLWQPDYGAGLPAYIGQPVDAQEIQALILSHMALESAVLRNPQPSVTVAPFPNGMAISITYTDSGTGTATTLSFDVTG